MNALIPLKFGPIHFIGIGGIGMSGIAEVLHNLGYQVQGSDLAESSNVARLRTCGIQVHVGHEAQVLGQAKVVVISSAVKADNPELMEARRLGVPVIRRAEMLGELMRLKQGIAVAGTHGKTTTSTLMGHVLECAGFDPTLITGGIVNATGTNTRLGDGDWMVVESDESDGSFLHLPATLGIVTNIDPEHLEHYGSFDALRDAFDIFIENLPFYGYAALCIDHPEVAALRERTTNRRTIGYGLSEQADVRGLNVRCEASGCHFDVQFRDGRTVTGYHLSMYGQHNVLNALAVLTLANELGIEDEVCKQALATFKGVKRRFTKVGEAHGVSVIDDYAHHPVEIAAVLKAARGASKGRNIAVVQPHRYTRLASLMSEFATCFTEADVVVVADVYSAGEAPITGASREALVAAIKAAGHEGVFALPNPEALPELINSHARAGDFVLCLGAGSITNWAAALPEQLLALNPQKVAV
jgi:UDP-N-acetylmuramate--alanine ligase